jgi:nitroimidazol reductase NimA-like FMN-containing flavoprotein (pyridoxamine 5'-phosphate oxidase superfamily)
MRVRTIAPQGPLSVWVRMKAFPDLPPESGATVVPTPREISPHECEDLLRSGVIGRVALSTPDGPLIIPVNYTVVDDTIVIRTSAYSALATYGRDAMLAFEVDHLDQERRSGWSVVARGRAWGETDADELARIRAKTSPRPWAGGSRNIYLRIRWGELSGRALVEPRTRGGDSSSPHAVAGTRLAL